MKRTLIKDATIINEGRSFTGSVIIEDDKIAKVIEGAVTTEDTYTEIIDAKGKYLIPGVIDDHGMQFALGNHSLASLFSSQWRGLYTQGNRSLYVNVGLGFLGIPFRFGA